MGDSSLESQVELQRSKNTTTMRTEMCHFSGLEIYPGHGKTYIKADGKKVLLINGKSEKLLKGKKNPRKVTWTILYRRKHKKGTMTELESRKRNRRALKTQRGIAGQSWAEIQAKKTVKPEVRKAQRDAAIAAAKQKKKESADKKKKANAAMKKSAPKASVSKNQKQGKGAAKNFKR